jgi:hypothetical protein
MAGTTTTTKERIGRVVDPEDVLTPEEAKEVRRGIEQIKEGRSKLWRDVKHELDR